MDAAEQLRKGLALHQAGNLAEAGQIYKEILESDPDNVDALNLMGVIMQAAGNLEAAVQMLQRAAELDPEFFAARVNLGNALQGAGRAEEAVDAFQAALKMNPHMPEVVSNLASALNDLGRHVEAVAICEDALSRSPDLAAARSNLANALFGMGKHERALEAYRQALTVDPENANTWFNAGNALFELEELEEALLHYQKAALLSPESAAKQYNLANTALLLDRFEEALDGFARAIEIEPDYLDAHCNMGVALQSLGRLDEAIAHLRRAVELAPAETENADLHWNLSLALLKNGDYPEGWREYEWRWQTPTFADFKREFSQPEWAGEPFEGKTILIHCEQGFGDGIQFARFVPLGAERGGRVVLECRPELKRLFGTLDGVDAVVGLGDPLPPVDVQVAHMSLPRVLDIRLETVPADIPYLRVPDDAHADARITGAAGLKVGFAWAGSATRSDNIKRSCEPALFAPFVNVPGTVFFSLQVGPYADQLAEIGPAVVDVTDTLDDFADTAAAIGALDLVVSVDTAVLHLAAALGRPAWGLMSEPTGFLWMTERDDSPWYPTVRLFRQPAPGDWESVFQAVRDELAVLADSAR